MTVRLCLDLNVLAADLIARRRGRKGTAASMLVEAVASGVCPAGPVQLVTSVPIIETWANVLRRHFGYDHHAADEMAWILQAYAVDGPLGLAPQVVVGSRFVPFESEKEMRQAIRAHAMRADPDKLFDEIEDDRHVLLAALAGRASVLATADIHDFTRGPAIRLARNDVVLFPLADETLVIARPSFIAHWLQRGFAPDHAFVRQHLDDFPPRP